MSTRKGLTRDIVVVTSTIGILTIFAFIAFNQAQEQYYAKRFKTFFEVDISYPLNAEDRLLLQPVVGKKMKALALDKKDLITQKEELLKAALYLEEYPANVAQASYEKLKKLNVDLDKNRHDFDWARNTARWWGFEAKEKPEDYLVVTKPGE